MSPRPRSDKNKDLPLNLSTSKNTFLYRRPTDGKKFSLGKDREHAKAVANRLNEHYAQHRGSVFSKIVDTEEFAERRFIAFLDRFDEEILGQLDLAEKTRLEYRRQMHHIKEAFGDDMPDEISTKDIADFLKRFPPRASNQYRTLLLLIFRWAKSDGIRKLQNPVTDTIAMPTRIKRERLTLEQYRTVWEHADPHIRNAMDLALRTLQRREDISALRFADYREGCLWVRPRKVRKHGVALQIEVSSELDSIIRRCRDGIVSPWMVHQPITANKARRGKQLSPGSISRGFQRAREAAHETNPDLFPEDPAKRPTFHEIRALGAKLYKELGINPKELLGHLDEKTTRVYLDRHQIKWVAVKAVLKLS